MIINRGIEPISIFFALTVILSACMSIALSGNREKALEEMIAVPAGEFTMGSSTKKDPTGGVSPFPERRVYVEAYSISRFETINAAYYTFVSAGGYDDRSLWQKKGWNIIKEKAVSYPRGWKLKKKEGYFPSQRAVEPVFGINWYEASAYAKWRGMRLPTEEEWEKAARGTDGRQYPWGDDFDKYRCNVAEAGIASALPVGGFLSGKSPYGIMDMCGNVEEWTRGPYYNIKGDIEKGIAVLRGGGWEDPASGSFVWSRHIAKKSVLTVNHYGIRLADD